MANPVGSGSIHSQEWAIPENVGPVLESDADSKIKAQWEHLKQNAPKGPIPITKIMDRVEIKYEGMPTILFFDYLAKEIRADFRKGCPNIMLDLSKNTRYKESLIVLSEPEQFIAIQGQMQKTENKEALHLIRSKDRLPRNMNFRNSDELDTIQILNLSGLGLRILPLEISFLRNLQILSLQNNQLENLPEWIGKLNHLKVLSLDQNKLTNLPESLTNLSELLTLTCAHNNFTSVPQFLGDLTQLSHLDLSHNRLTCIPDSFSNFNLSVDLRKNPLLFILPHNLDKNPKLQTLLSHRDACQSYQCRTQIAQFFQTLICSDFRTAQELFPSLPDSFKHRLASDYGQQGGAFKAVPKESSFNSSILRDVEMFVDVHLLGTMTQCSIQALLSKDHHLAVENQIRQLRNEDRKLGASSPLHPLYYIDAASFVLYPSTVLPKPAESFLSKKRKREDDDFMDSILN